ncbi:MAG: hypothetical protein ACHQRJ_21900 [Alphaproteobacteria bacterium]
MAFSIILTILGLGAFCALLYNFAVYALPAFVGFSVGYWAIHSGAGVGSIVVGFAAALAVLLAGQVTFAKSRSLPLRWLLVLLFAAPAVWAGYSVVLQLSELGVPSPTWQHVFAVIGAVFISCTAIVRLRALQAESRPARQRPASSPAHRRPSGLQKSMLVPGS